MTSCRFLVINGVISQTTEIPPISTFLETNSGAYTTTRTHNNGACVLFWEKHLRRLAESARIIADLRPQGIRVSSTGSWESVIGSLVDDSFRKVLPVALKERGSGDELAITTLVTWGLDHLNGDKGVCGNDEDRLVRSINAYVHVGVYVPLVFGVRENGAHLAVVGRGRDNAKAKFSQWVRFRKCLEALRPPLANELLLSNDGDRILEGCVTNFFVVCRKENADAVVEGSSDPRNTNAFEVQTASIDDGVLPGVIRQLVIEVCLDKRIPVREIAPSWSKCELWEEAFTTNSLRLVQHVETIQVPSSWEMVKLKTWKEISWKEKCFKGGPGIITEEIQREIIKRATHEGFKISGFTL